MQQRAAVYLARFRQWGWLCFDKLFPSDGGGKFKSTRLLLCITSPSRSTTRAHSTNSRSTLRTLNQIASAVLYIARRRRVLLNIFRNQSTAYYKISSPSYFSREFNRKPIVVVEACQVYLAWPLPNLTYWFLHILSSQCFSWLYAVLCAS